MSCTFEEIPYCEDTFTAVHEIQAKLLQYVSKYSNSVLHENTMKKLSSLSAKLIKTLLQHSIIPSESQSPIIVSREVGKVLNTLVIVSQMPGIKTVLVRKLAPVVFETVSDPSINGWCGNEILKTFNVIIQNSDKNMRHELIADNNLMHLLKLIDLLSVCGDYNYQTVIVECIYRMCSKEMLIKYSKDLIPEDDKLRKKFLQINNQTFDRDVRTFLNMLNGKSKSVYSIVCDDVLLDDASHVGPLDYELKDGLWVDFNVEFRSISWFVDKSFYLSENHELFILPAQIVENSTVEMLDDKNKIKISFRLKGDIIAQTQHVNNSKYLHLIMKKTKKAELIASQIVKQILQPDFKNRDRDAFLSSLKKPEEKKKKCFAVHRENIKKGKIASNKGKYHMLTENRLLQADVIEITSDEDDTPMLQVKSSGKATYLEHSDVSVSDSMILPASHHVPLEDSPSTVYSSSKVLNSRRSKSTEKSKAIVFAKSVDYQPKTAMVEIRSPVSLSTFVIEEETKEPESEYYTAQIDWPDSRNKQERVNETFIQSRYAKSIPVTSATMMNEVASSVDSDIQRLTCLEQLKSRVPTKATNTAAFKRKAIQESHSKRKICIAKSRTQLSSSSSSDENDIYETGVSIDLLQAIESTDKNLKKNEVNESETPDNLEEGVDVIDSVISVKETPQENERFINTLTNKEVTKRDVSLASQGLQANSNSADESQPLLNEDEIKESLSQASTEKLSNNNSKHMKPPTTANTFAPMEDESVQGSENQKITDDKNGDKGEKEALKLSQVPTENFSSTNKESQRDDCSAEQVISQSITSTQYSHESTVNKNDEAQQENSPLSAHSEDNSSSPLFNRKAYKKKRNVPLIKDDTCSNVSDSSESSNKKDNIKPVCHKIMESDVPQQAKDIFSEDNIINDNKSQRSAIQSPVSTEKPSPLTNNESNKLLSISCQLVQTNEPTALSPVIVMDRIKLKGFKNKGQVKKTYSRTGVIDTDDAAPVKVQTVMPLKTRTRLRRKQKAMGDVADTFDDVSNGTPTREQTVTPLKTRTRLGRKQKAMGDVADTFDEVSIEAPLKEQTVTHLKSYVADEVLNATPIKEQAVTPLESRTRLGRQQKSMDDVADTFDEVLIEAPLKEQTKEKKQKAMDDVEPNIIASGPAIELHDNRADDQLQKSNVYEDNVEIPETNGNNVSVHEEDLDEMPNETAQNITKTTSSSKKRRLFVPDDLTYLEGLPGIKEGSENPTITTVKSSNQKEEKTAKDVPKQKFVKGIKRKQWDYFRNEVHVEKKKKKKNKPIILYDLDKWLEAIKKRIEREDIEEKKRQKESRRQEKTKKPKRNHNKVVKQKRTSYKKLKAKDGKHLHKKAKVEKRSDKYGTVPKKSSRIAKDKHIRIISNIVIQKAKHPELETITDHQRIFESTNEPLRLNQKTLVSESSVGLPRKSEKNHI